MTNPYHDAMDRCVPPEGLRERIEENVLAGRPGRSKTFKPKGFRKKAVVVLLAAVLLLTSATTIWDPLFVRRFGPGAALSALGGAVFQEVNVTSVCDDVSLTVTQALCSDKSFYLLLEYKLPDGVTLGEDEPLIYPDFYFYGTGDYTWEEFKALDGENWKEYDWSDFLSFAPYLRNLDRDTDRVFPLSPYDLTHRKEGGTGTGSGSGSYSTKGYDPETNTVTLLLSHDFDTGWNLNEQPLTILATPPRVKHGDGTETAVTDHPAIVTFQPVYDGPQARSGFFEEGAVKLTATLSPFSLALEADGMDYPSYEDMVKNVRLVAKDGTEKQVSQMGYTNGGSGITDVDSGRAEEVSTTVHFILLTDISEFTAIRVGDYELPLN